MLMFCDDDDTYHNIRVETFIQYFEQGKKYDPSSFYGGVREVVNSSNPGSEQPEYWTYGIRSDILTDFFPRFSGDNNNLLKHKFGDLYLRKILAHHSKIS